MAVARGFSFETNCVTCPGDDAGAAINAMTDTATRITRATFLRYIDMQELWDIERRLGYARRSRQGLTMQKDWHVGYFKSTFRGRPCVYFVHSAIEWVFTPRSRRADVRN